jgi:hypothetical protein
MGGQMDIFTLNGYSKNNEEAVNELKNADVGNMTPLDALNLVYRLQKLLGKV